MPDSRLPSLDVTAVKTTGRARPLMVPVLPVHPAGMAHDVNAHVRLVFMAMAAKISVHGAGITNHVTQKPGNVGNVILDGLDPGVHEFLRKKKGNNRNINWAII